MKQTIGQTDAAQLTELLGRRGAASVSLLLALDEGALRFGELRERMAHISQKTLVADLRALEHTGAVNRIVFAEIPPRVEYSLTPAGEELLPSLRTVWEWCAQHGSTKEEEN